MKDVVRRVVEVDPAYSSQTCAECGHVAAESRRSQETFVCVACGHRANADVNAALPVTGGVVLVILSVVLTLIGGLIPSRKAAKQDPATALRTE